MANPRPFAFALIGLLAVTTVAPVCAQTSAKPSKQEKKATPKPAVGTRKEQRQMENRAMRTDNSMRDNMAPSMQNNTAAAQANIDRANKTLSDMVALLDQIEARKK